MVPADTKNLSNLNNCGFLPLEMPQELFHIAPQDIRLQIEPCARPDQTQVRVFPCIGYECNRKAVLPSINNGQAGPIKRNKAFRHDVRTQVCWELNFDSKRNAILFDRKNGDGSLDMSLD